MKPSSDVILFDEPFNRLTHDRLRFVFLYFDVVEVVDHSAHFAEYEQSGWGHFWDASAIRREIEKACHERGIRDKNQINLRYVAALKKAQEARAQTQPILRRAYQPHQSYWRFLRDLRKQGHVRIVQAPLDQKFTPSVAPQDAKSVAGSVATEFMGWVKDYLRRTAP